MGDANLIGIEEAQLHAAQTNRIWTETKPKKKMKGKNKNWKEAQVLGTHQTVDDMDMDGEKRLHKRKQKKNQESEEAPSHVDPQTVDNIDMDGEKKWKKKKKKKKKKKHSEEAQADVTHQTVDDGDMESEKKLKEKRKMEKRNKNLGHTDFNDEMIHEEQREEKSGMRRSVPEGDDLENAGKRKKKRKRKEMLCDDKSNEGVREFPAEGPPHKKQKRVSFSDRVQVFSGQDTTEQEMTVNSVRAATGPPVPTDEKDKLVWTKRFTPEEDAAIKDAMLKYIKERGMDEDDGLRKVLNCKKYPEIRNCWKEIGACIYWRPHASVYRRAHVLYERALLPCWSKDELHLLKGLYAVHGNKWKKLADTLGKSRYHVKDTWRRLKRGTMNAGQWSQDEYQKIFDLVNLNLQQKSSAVEENHTSKRVLRNNLCWESIADKMTTRDHVNCCKKWYYSLSSSMVESGQWANEDDRRLLKRLLESNASDEEGIDWNDLLENRSGETCLKRWRQMAKYLGEYRSRSFLERLDLLVKRYAPDLIE